MLRQRKRVAKLDSFLLRCCAVTNPCACATKASVFRVSPWLSSSRMLARRGTTNGYNRITSQESPTNFLQHMTGSEYSLYSSFVHQKMNNHLAGSGALDRDQGHAADLCNRSGSGMAASCVSSIVLWRGLRNQGGKAAITTAMLRWTIAWWFQMQLTRMVA